MKKELTTDASSTFGVFVPVAESVIGAGVVVLLSIELLVLGLITEGCGQPS